MTELQQHCEHECVCPDKTPFKSFTNQPCNMLCCPHDTRSRPAPSPEEKPCDHCDFQERDEREDNIARQAAAQAREKVLDELDKKIKHMQKESSELYNKATTDVGALAMNCRRNDCIDFRKFIQSLRSTPMTPKEQP